MFTLRQLETFREVMRQRTTVGAAEALKISQPAVSNALKQMEERAGLVLFERLGNRLVPTPDAEEIFRDTEAIFKLYGAFNHRIEARKRSELGSLRIVATPPVANGLIPGMVSRFLAQRPSVHLNIDMRRMSGVLESVEARMADIGFGLNPMPRDGLEIRVIGQVPLLCCFRPGHRLEQHDRIGGRALRGEKMIVYEPGSPIDQLAANLITTEMRDRAAAEVRYSSLACLMAEAGMGIAIADSLTAVSGERYRLSHRPLDPPLTAPVCVVLRAGEPMKRVQAAFLSEIERAIAIPGLAGTAST
ncbi:LysR substrate-binding domain-containing protein [Paracoccus sp. TK19116]|uniref:LysR substrate-binding domain-containing protein n=1 Tax=Paracoccus albicereus TaxID=2922394 RepID=A0ABT1MNN2_9RHOB|nr:LysR substrate-binding domain-containing protein [Paracoccus albicereus]MCQ0969895.1 LysR substrate-binding domain-containing protein [Paracoccus albicereus]